MIRSIFTTAFSLFFLAAFAGQTNYYTVKFPDDYTVYGCGADPGITYPYITQYGGCNINVGVAHSDQIFYTNATGGCYKILRTWTLINWCDYDPNWPSPTIIQNPSYTDVGPTVTGNSYNHGYLQYTQIIKVIDTDNPVFLDCPSGTVTFCDYTNNDPTQYKNGPYDKCEGPVDLHIKVTDACSGADLIITYRLFLDLDGNGSMETYVPSSSPSAYPIVTEVEDDTLSAHIEFPPGFGLPYGKHKIEWVVNDKCGNESICKYEFIVKDCKAPTIVCHNGLSINIMATGMITLWDTDFILYAEDNCTPANQIKFGIRKLGAGTGFPVDMHSVTFDCNELDKQYVEVWAQDAYGNADFCKTYVIVQDNIGACPPSSPFKGTIASESLKPVKDALVTLKKGTQTVATAMTDADGQYAFGSISAGANYSLIPFMNDQPKNGVNTLDALLVAGHLSDDLPIYSPYQLLAGDVNKSGGIDMTDVMSITKLTLGVNDNFPGNTSWQFVPSSYVFPNPSNPWSASVPASLTNLYLMGPINFNPNFVAIKTGDLNYSVNSADLADKGEPRTEEQKTVLFSTSEKYFGAGDEVAVDIFTPELDDISAFQFTLDYDTEVLSAPVIEPDLVSADFIATPGGGRVTAAWYSTAMLDPATEGQKAKLRTFRVVFNALKSGKLSQVLHMSSSLTAAEAYDRQLATLDAALEFKPTLPTKTKLELFAVRPNPASDQFTATYYLPEAGLTTLTLSDATGRVLQTIQADNDRGYHETRLNLDDSMRSGLLLLRLEGPGGSAMQKVMKL